MNRRRPEPMQVVKERRDAALSALVEGVPFMGFLGVTVDRRGDELTTRSQPINASARASSIRTWLMLAGSLPILM